MSKKLDDILGLGSLPVIIDPNSTDLEITDQEPLDSIDEQAESDFVDVRENLTNAVEVAEQALKNMLNIAEQSQHPKAYEVLDKLIKTYADINMGVADLQLKKQRLAKKTQNTDGQSNVTNNLFVGSTAELQQMIENMKNKSE